MIKAIFFDQDNTIFDTSKHSKKLYKDALVNMAQKLEVDADLLLSKWKSIVEKVKLSSDPLKRKFDYSLAKTLYELELPGTYLDTILSDFYSTLVENLNLTEGTREFFIKDLAVKKILFTEDSNKNNIRKLTKFNLLDEFDLILNSEKIGVMKPDIKYLETAWETLNLDPNDCLYIGDNWDKDLRLGQENGGVGVLFGGKDVRADFEINNMLELVNIINKL